MRVSLVSSTSALLALLPFSSFVQAGTKCDARLGCGFVLNSSPWHLKVTKVEDEDKKTNATPHRCAFDNWNLLPPRAQTVWCYQIDVGTASSVGGKNDHDDADGLTYADRTWYFNGNKKDAGHWQKIWDGTRVNCWNKDGKAWCEDGYNLDKLPRRVMIRGRSSETLAERPSEMS